jgi:hypothetical protein
VNDYWICGHCKSLNRAGTGKCYRCKNKYGSQPNEVPVVRAPAPPPSTPGSRPIPGAAPPAGFFTGPSVGQGVVGPGGVPVDPGVNGELPAYLSRPLQGPAFTSTSYLTEQGARGGPIGWLRRRASAWLAPRQSVSVWLIGYVSAGLLTLLLVDGAIILTTISSAISVALQTASLTGAWAELGPGRQSAVTMLVVALGVIGGLALLSFSVFVGLSTHNGAGIGLANLRLTPGSAMTCWWKTTWAQLKLAVGFLLPAGLLVAGNNLPGNHLPGLVAALVAVEWAQRSLGDPFGFITNPANHLADLYGRMGISGVDGSLLGSAWKICFMAANSLAIVAYALPVIAVSAVAAETVAGRPNLLSMNLGGFTPAQLAFLIVGLPLLLTVAASLALLVPICIDMVERQRTRSTMARVGRVRSWIEPPGSQSGAARGIGARPQEPEPEPDRGYDPRHGGYDSSELVGGSSNGYGSGQDRGYETRESGGYDDRGFGTGDEGRGYDDRGWDTRR